MKLSYIKQIIDRLLEDDVFWLFMICFSVLEILRLAVYAWIFVGSQLVLYILQMAKQ